MQKPSSKTLRMNLIGEEELFNRVIPTDNSYRQLNDLLNIAQLVEPLRDLYSNFGQTGIDVEKGFRALLVQFWEDYSDRELEQCVRENLAVRWFCGFSLQDSTPDHSYFGKLRDRIGTTRLAQVFNEINRLLREQGLFGDVFTFVDASSLITKTKLWKERDKAIQAGEEHLNNTNVRKYAADQDARWGAKSETDIWFGYKRHQAVDMRHGLISNVLVTPANVMDFKVLADICPNRGMIFADKLYDCREADQVIASHSCYAGTIRKKNNQRKNRDLDRWRSGIRMPFEGTFSKLRKRAKYRSKPKVSFQCFFEAICHNLKKAVRILPLRTEAMTS